MLRCDISENGVKAGIRLAGYNRAPTNNMDYGRRSAKGEDTDTGFEEDTSMAGEVN